MTLKEIAEIAGVSTSTVSRIINKNDEKCASKELREHVWDIVRQTGYTPNKFAQSLKLSKKDEGEPILEHGLACIFARVKDIHNDQFFNSIYRIAEQEAFKYNYLIKYALSFTQLNDASALDLFEHTNVDGAIILGRCNKNLLTFLSKYYKNIVYVGLNRLDFPIDQIICDGYYAASEAVAFLNLLGHTKIGYVGELNNEIRYKGYCDKLKELNIPVVRDFIVDVPLTIEGGYKGTKELLNQESYPTSVFCCNDIAAVGAIKAVKEKGLKIPEDFSVISIDDIEMASYMTPMLTTVRVPRDEMGKMAVKLLLDRVKHRHKLPVKVELPFNIIKRESCCPPKCLK